MTTVSRQPLAPRVLHQLPLSTVPHVPTKLQLTPNLKRARSPDPHAYHALHEINAVKRHRTQSAATKENIPDKEKRRAEREALKEEFRIKYTRAFPSWTFYFDIPDAERDVLAPRILYLNGVSSHYKTLKQINCFFFLVCIKLTCGGVMIFSILPSSFQTK